jgi:paraquat-inducible protein A
VGPCHGQDAPLCFAITGLLLLVPAVLLPFAGASELGNKRISLLLTGVTQLLAGGIPSLSLLVLLCGALLPAALLIIFVTIYAPFRFGSRWSIPPVLVRAARILTRWAFPEVQILGVVVGAIKLGSLVHMSMGPGFWCYCGMTAASLMASHCFKYSWPWPEEAAERDVAVPDLAGSSAEWFGSRARSTCAALAVTALVMLVPANVLPVLTTDTSGQHRTDTIFSGALGLGQQGLWSLAAIVFAASILIPALKLGGLACLLFTRPNPGPARARRLTLLYSGLAFIGRWSMLDVFLGAFLVGLVRFGRFANIEARGGLIAFAAVVILTVFATEMFDPEEIWTEPARPSPSP